MLRTDLHNWFRKSDSGLYELYAEGEPYALGQSIGRLSRELIVQQEDYFSEQILKMIPSRSYLHFLKYLIRWFNRNLFRYVPDEYLREIRGVSEFASEDYGYIGDKYGRILNYHAAHDIGHALQNLALVGCSSFGTWGSRSENGRMIVGRNFDFYVGDNFAKNKIVAFIKPQKGHAFMSVTWGGFMGVVSGMNDQGLTVTINAAKSSIPLSSATPVSLVAREILQYASNISEAYAIAGKRKMFVSESFLVGSAVDGKAVLIEKTPKALRMYDPGEETILCTNHFQASRDSASSSKAAPPDHQQEQSASGYRYRRLRELLDAAGPNTTQKTAAILRDQRGIGGKNIGMGNEKAMNQLIAHHSIIFEPLERRVWVSTAPWQLGRYVCYDLDKMLSMRGRTDDAETYESAAEIGVDPFLNSPAFDSFEQFRAIRQEMEMAPIQAQAGATGANAAADGLPDRLVAANPEFYHAYVLAGDYVFKRKDYPRAKAFYEQALTKEIATAREENHIRKQIKKCSA